MAKRESFGSTLRQDLINDLRGLSEETGIPISKLLDKAVDKLLSDMKFERGTQRSTQSNKSLRE
jgi:hypothetical protein